MYTLIPTQEERDKQEVCQWISRQFHFDPATTMQWIEQLHFNWELSVRALDPEGHTIGYLNMSDYRIQEETEQMAADNPELLLTLNRYSYTSVFSFIVAPQYRGTRLNYDMLMSIWPRLQQYDFIFVPVMHQLKTHQYWQRWGGILFYEDKVSKYYLIPNNPELVPLVHQLYKAPQQ